MKQDQATKIADDLNNTAKWHSHGYGISKEVLEREVGLIIDDFGIDHEKSSEIRDYHSLLADYMGRIAVNGTAHIVGSFKPISFS
jgi:hypothetical protein